MKFKHILFFILISNAAFSMNVKSLEINYENVGGLTYRADVVFYLYNSSPVDSFIEINWGDNTYSFISPTSTEDIPGELKRVVYSGTHTYSGPSTFKMFVSYKVRSINVINVPNSLITDIYVEAEVVVSPFLVGAKSPKFYNNPTLNICKGISNSIDFSAYDADGDTLVYSIIPCRGENGMAIYGFSQPAPASNFSIDKNTGILKWDNPTTKGFFNYAVKVSKYRKGVLLGSIMRDALVNVIDCTPDMASLNIPSDTCIIAGNSFNKNISATYSGSDTITLTAIGEPFLVENPASFIQPVRGKNNVNSDFNWNIICKHIRPEPYSVTFKAELEDSLSSNCDCVYDFNNMQLHPFISNVPVMFSNPCGAGWDNSPYLWIGSDSAAPRYIISPSYNMTSGNHMVVFDMRFSDHTGNPGTDCEGPDLPDEGIYLQYSTSGINGQWNTIAYWDPSLSPGEGGHMVNLIGWGNYSVVVPNEALSANTRFRWAQFFSSGKEFDHWGLDNIAVYKISDKLPAEKETNITVIAPEPENLSAAISQNNVSLKWNKPSCANGDGYYIYRKIGASGYIPTNCDTGIPSWTNYKLIAVLNDINDTTFIDNNNGLGLPHGNQYCYIITSWFNNGAVSRASNEACVIFPDDVPVITNVSVITTNNSNGKMFVAWSRPDDLDEITYPGPYKYDIYRANGIDGNDFSLIESNFGLNDTLFLDSLIDTKNKAYRYKIDLLYASGTTDYVKYASSFPASSVYLSHVPNDKKILLNWDYNVPWQNDSTLVFRLNDTTNNFDFIGVSHSQSYLDADLINGKTYCYKVETVGAYSQPNFVFPIRNMSQEICAEPVDLEPPCEVALTVATNCDDVSNTLVWTNPEHFCDCDDVSKYLIYYSTKKDAEFILIATVPNKNDTTFKHNPESSIAGCYAVVAVDTNGNRSEFSNIVCVDIDQCDLYRLPNVFTPNNDQHNDVFKPFPYDFVEKINIKIFDRWGIMVFTTENPDIMWDGKNQYTNLDCSEGVYYYICEVYEMRLSGIRKRIITGTVNLYR